MMEITSVRRPWLRLVGPVVLTVALAACARSVTLPPGYAAGATTTSPAVAPSPAPSVSGGAHSPVGSASPAAPLAIPAAVQGLWTAKVSGTSASSGAWKMRITKDDITLHNPVSTDPNDYFSMGPSGFDATTLTLTPSSDCPDQATVTEGHYTWKLAGGTLTFTLVSDSCTDRSGVLTASSWVKAP